MSFSDRERRKSDGEKEKGLIKKVKENDVVKWGH